MTATALTRFHRNLGAKIVPFAGFDMPLFYGLGIVKEHLWVRNSCGIFDVSHMGQLLISGENAAKLLSVVTPTDFSKAKIGQAKYTTFLSNKCTIIDDLIVTKIAEDKFFVVVNAARKETDVNFIKKFLEAYDCQMELLDKSLLAVQGPKSEAVLSKILNVDLEQQKYMSLQQVSYSGEEIFVSRVGYTGEDGFEISVSNQKIVSLWQELMDNNAVKPIGLGARDSLRLEMGYPLYGHDLSEDINLGSCALKWIITSNENYCGKENCDTHPQKKRVGVKLLDKGIARENMEVYNKDHKKIGFLTSAGYSPILECSIGQAYIDSKYSDIGTEIYINIREKFKKAEVSKICFLSPKTKK